MVNPLLPLLELRARFARKHRKVHALAETRQEWHTRHAELQTGGDLTDPLPAAAAATAALRRGRVAAAASSPSESSCSPRTKRRRLRQRRRRRRRHRRLRRARATSSSSPPPPPSSPCAERLADLERQRSRLASTSPLLTREGVRDLRARGKMHVAGSGIRRACRPRTATSPQGNGCRRILLPNVTQGLPPPDAMAQPGIQRLLLRGGGAVRGAVTLSTMTELLRRDFSPVLIQTLTGFLQRSDKDHTQSLDKGEMLHFLALLYDHTGTPLPRTGELEREIADAFEKFDKDANEVMDLTEIVSFLRVCHLSMSMNKKWRPKLSAEDLTLKRQLEEERLRRLQEECRRRRQEKERRRKAFREDVTRQVEWEAACRAAIVEDEDFAARRVELERAQEAAQFALWADVSKALTVLFYRYAKDNRRALVRDFCRHGERLKTQLVRESLNLVNVALRAALEGKDNHVNRGVEALFSTVGYKCSLNRLVKDMQERCDDGNKDEVEGFLDMFGGDGGGGSGGGSGMGDGGSGGGGGLGQLPAELTTSGGFERWAVKLQTFSSPREVEALSIRLQEYYYNKYPDNLNMLGEITENLGARFCDVVYLASALYRRHRRIFPNNSPSAILVMCLYTCEGKHIEKLLQLPEDSAPVIYKDINWALREGHKSSNVEAQETLKRWVGFIAVLSTTKVNATQTAYRNHTLYRGLMNLPETVYLDYMEKEAGEYVYWPAATSASLEKALVVNEFTKEGTSLVFVMDGWTEAAEMWHVSLYFEEKEMLLPPFTVFSVSRVDRAEGRVYLQVMGSLGDHNVAETGYTKQVDRDFAEWLRKVVQDKSHEAIATQILAIAALRHEVESLPSVFLSCYSKLLTEEQQCFNVTINTFQTWLSAMWEVPRSVQQHVNALWKHVNNSAYLTKIAGGDFGVDFTEVIEKAVHSLSERWEESV